MKGALPTKLRGEPVRKLTRMVAAEAAGQRIAWTTGTREARHAGKKPPSTPITTAKTRPASSSPGVTRKLKAISLKLAQLVVLVTIPLIGSARRHPTPPPTAAMITDSTRKL